MVHVSIVNWIKGKQPGKKKLFLQQGNSKDSPWTWIDLDVISSSLSFNIDVTAANVLAINANSHGCYQGQTHGNTGFLLTHEEYTEEIRHHDDAVQYIHPYLTAEDLIGSIDSLPSRYVVDFEGLSVLVLLC